MSTGVGNKRWGIVFLLVLTYFVLYSTRTSMAITKGEFGWDAAQFGWVNTAFFIGYAISMMPAGALGDKFGGGRVLCYGILFFCLFTFLTPFAASSSFILIILVRVLVGIGQGCGMPGIASTIAQWVPKSEAGRAQGFCLVGIPISTALTWAIGPSVMKMWGPASLFIILALLGPIWVVLWKMFGANKPEDHTKVSKEELVYIRSDQAKAQSAAAAQQVPNLTSKDIYCTPSVWAAAISYFCSNYLFFLFLSWLPTYFKEGRGWSLETGMYPYLAAIITYPLGGVLADLAAKKFGVNFGRKLFPILGLVLAGAMLILGSKASSQGMAVLYISLSNGFLCLTMGGFFSIPMEFSPKNAGKIVGFNGMWGTAAGILAPMITGYIIKLTNNNYDVALYVGAAVAVVGALVMLLGCKVKPINPAA